MSRCGPTSPACVCRASARAWNRWRRGSTRDMCGPATSRCITSWPTRRGIAAAVLRVARDVGAGADGPARAGGGVDRRRHGLSQEGPALGGRGPAVLRRAGQAGQLPGGGERVGGQRRRQRAGRVSTLPAGELGHGSPPAAGGRGPGRPSRSSPSGRSPWSRSGAAGRGRAGGAGRGGRRLWRYDGVSRRADDRARSPMSWASKARPRCGDPATPPLPPKRWSGRGRPPTLVRRTATHRPVELKTLARPAARGVAPRDVARRHPRGRCARASPAVRVRPAHRDEYRTDPRPEEWLLIEWPAGEPEPTKYLALDAAGDDLDRRPRPPRQAALAHRARLSGTQGRTGAGSLRRPWLAGLPSPRRLMYRGVCLPRRRAREAFPPSASGLPPSRSPSQRFHAAGRSRCGLNATCPPRSPPPTRSSPARCSSTRNVPGVARPRLDDDSF